MSGRRSERRVVSFMREAQLSANEQRRDTADLDSEGGKKAEKGRARGKPWRRNLLLQELMYRWIIIYACYLKAPPLRLLRPFWPLRQQRWRVVSALSDHGRSRRFWCERPVSYLFTKYLT